MQTQIYIITNKHTITNKSSLQLLFSRIMFIRNVMDKHYMTFLSCTLIIFGYERDLHPIIKYFITANNTHTKIQILNVKS